MTPAESPAAVPPRPLNGRDACVCLLLVLALLAGTLPSFASPGCGEFHDDAIYLTSAQALAQGEGYRLASLPGAPAQTKYPPLYPLMLAGLWQISPDFPDNLLLLRSVSLVSGLAALCLTYLFLVRFGYASRLAAFSVCILTATSSPLLALNVMLLSEMPFALMLVLALWRLESSLQRSHSTRAQTFVDGVILALPYLCRSVGITLIPVALFLWWRKGRSLFWSGLGLATLVAPWIAWTSVAALDHAKDPVVGYYTDYLGWWVTFGTAAIHRILFMNVASIVTGFPANLFWGEGWALAQGDQTWKPLFVVLGALLFDGLVHDVRRGRPLSLALTAYLLLVAIWPWAPYRFMLPILPLAGVYLFRPGSLNRDVVNLPRAALAVFALLMLFGVARNVQILLREPLVERRESSFLPGWERRPADWRHYQTLFAWVREHTHAEDLLVSDIDPMLYLYTQRQGIRPITLVPQCRYYQLPPPEPNLAEKSLDTLNRLQPRYLVRNPWWTLEPEFDRWVLELLKKYPNQMQRVYHDPDDPRFEVYRIHYPLVETEIAQRQP